MTLERVLNWLPVSCWLVMMAERWIRVIAYRRRGLRVIVNDLRRPKAQLLFDLVLLILFLLWLYLTAAEVLPLPIDWLPASLMRRIATALPVRLVGSVFVIAATILYEMALQQMGDSWRIGIDHNKPGPLVATGLFAWLRNPIYVAFYLMFIGTFLVFGRVIYLLLAILLILFIHGIILREERFLEHQFGGAFRDYRSRVRRYGLL